MEHMTLEQIQVSILLTQMQYEDEKEQNQVHCDEYLNYLLEIEETLLRERRELTEPINTRKKKTITHQIFNAIKNFGNGNI